ncbi:hypothetical protein ASG71_00150 [Arthrobacter sp. Soil763]|nr:hypothetical protein ASG71_00150 [Arthrobacter sp. Soil763]
MVKFKTEAAGRASARAHAYGQAARSSGVSVKELRATARGAAVVQAAGTLTPSEGAKVLASLRSQANVEYAEPDTFLRQASTPNDPMYPRQWDLFEDKAGMRVPAAWDVTSGHGAVVAVIDTGITPHSDLTQVLPGYDFISDSTISNDGDGRDSDATDAGDYCNGDSSSWHGTHVAGTIGAAANNGIGIAGVAYSSSILPVRALGACGGYLSDVADAVVWAAGGAVPGVPDTITPARVINMSLGGDGQCGTYFQSALDFAAARGVTVVAAAGNENSPASGSTPANCSNIVTVGATGREGNRAYYSNYGPEVDVSAPGGDGSTGGQNTILSTWNNGTTVPGAETYGYMQGTSMAAPHVAGAAALITAANPALTPGEVEAILKQTARPLPGTCDTGGCGAGLVDAAAAVQAAAAGAVTPEPIVPGTPSIRGSATVGSVLSADPGTWTPNTTLRYQWYRAGAAIAAAAGSTYTVAPADLGQVLSVVVTGTKYGCDPATATSEPTQPVDPGSVPDPVLTVTGSARVGMSLLGTLTDQAGWQVNATQTWQWYRSGAPVPGATHPKYDLTAADLGKAVMGRVTRTQPGYTTIVKETPAYVVSAGILSGPAPIINGTRKVGYALTAAPGTWTPGAALRYQWYRSGSAITGATAAKYTLGAADQGKAMRVRVTGTKAGYTTLYRDSATTGAVATGTLIAGTPWISGYPRYGYTLAANPRTWTAGTTLRYQWYRSGVAIRGATGRYYRLVWADRYDTIKVRVIGSKAGYATVTKWSGPSIRIP